MAQYRQLLRERSRQMRVGRDLSPNRLPAISSTSVAKVTNRRKLSEIFLSRVIEPADFPGVADQLHSLI
jgi:hypothetical protein